MTVLAIRVFSLVHNNLLNNCRVCYSRYSRSTQEEVQVTQKPRFLGPLKGTNKIVEGQRAHFEARVEPQSDTTMKVREMSCTSFYVTKPRLF